MRFHDLKLTNLQEALLAVQELKNPSRADIGKYLNLSRTTASENINTLISLELVSELGVAINGRGRPGKQLDLNTSRWYALGVVFESRDLYFSVIDIKGKIIEKKHLQITPLTFESFIETLIEGITYFLGAYKDHLLPCIGIGSPGVIDKDQKTIVKAVDLGWFDKPIKEIVKSRLGLDCLIQNRYRTFGLAESKYGQGKDYSDFVYLGVGSGFGTAIFMDKKLVSSTNIHTGGIGHIVVEDNGPLCKCGKHGCLFTVGSQDALIRNTLSELEDHKDSALYICHEKQKTLTLIDIMQAANNNDAYAMENVRKVADPLCKVIAFLINILNPQRIILGGPMGMNGNYYCTYIASTIEKNLQTSEISIVQSHLDYFGGAVGAASMVLDNILEFLIEK